MATPYMTRENGAHSTGLSDSVPGERGDLWRKDRHTKTPSAEVFGNLHRLGESK